MFNNSLQINSVSSVLFVPSNRKKGRNLCSDLTYVQHYYIKQNKIVGNSLMTQMSNNECNRNIGTCAVNMQLKNFLKNYKYEKLINNYKEFNKYSTITKEAKLDNSLLVNTKYKIVSPVIKQPVSNKKINTLTTFLIKATSINNDFDNYNLLKQAACYARVLKFQSFFSKQTSGFTSTASFIFFKKKNRLKTLHVLENINKTKGVVFKQNYRTYSFLQTLLAKSLETTPNTKTNLVDQPNSASYQTFLRKQGLCTFMTSSQFPQVFFFINAYITTLKKKLQNQQVISTDQYFIFNKINTKSFLGYWLIPIAGFAFITPNIMYNSTVQLLSTHSYADSVLSFHTLPIDIKLLKNAYSGSPNILLNNTSLSCVEGLNPTNLNFLKQNDLLPFSYQYSQSFIIKKTFNNLYSYIKAKTTLSKTPNIIPITQTIMNFSVKENFQKKDIINFLRDFVTKNAQLLQLTPNYIQKKSINNVNIYAQLSNNLMPFAILQSLNNKFKRLYENYIFKKNIYALTKSSFSFESNNLLKGFVDPFSIILQFKKSKFYYKNMLYLRAINPLYSNLILNNNISFIKDKKTLKLIKIKIIELNKTQKKINNRFELTHRLNKLKMLFGKTDKVSSTTFPIGINKPIISKLFETTQSTKTIIDSKPFDNYKESLILINLNLKHNPSIMYCKNILNKYNKINKLKSILNLKNLENKNKILLNYFLVNQKIYNTTKLLKLKFNLIKTIINVSQNKMNHTLLTTNYFNYPLIKPISLEIFTNLKIILTRFNYDARTQHERCFDQKLTNNVLSNYFMPSLYKNYIKTQVSNNKIIHKGKLCYYDKQNINYKTKSFKVNTQRKLLLSHGVKNSFSTLSSKENLNSLSVLFKHQKMFKTKTENQKQRLQIQKKRKAKKQRLETRRQKKRTRFFPRPTWLRYRMFINFINQRKLTLVHSGIKKDKKSPWAVTFLKRKNKAFKNLFLHKKNYNLSSLNDINLNYTVKNKKSVISEIIYKNNQLVKEGLKNFYNFYTFFNVPIKILKKNHPFKHISLRDIKMGTSYVKTNYINFKNQKTNNPPSLTEKDKDTIFRDFWIWAYNNTQTNTINQKLWWLLPNNTSMFINPFFSDLVKTQKFYMSQSNNTFTNNPKQIKNIFAIARINWALHKTNNNSFTDYNKRYNLWGSQKLRNQSKNNKTKFLEKQFIDFFNKNIFLNKKLSAFYKKLSSKLSQKTQKLNYLTNYSYNLTYYHFLKTKNIKIFNNFFWSNLNFKTLVKNTYYPDKQQDTFLVLTTQPNNFKNFLTSTFNFKPVEKRWNIISCYNSYLHTNFIVPLIISCLILLHLCSLISLVSISQVRCFVKFHLILVYKLSNVYRNIVEYITYIPKRQYSNIVLKQKTFDFLTNTTTPNFKTNLLLLKENQNRLLTFLSFNLLKKKFKKKNNVSLNLYNFVKLKNQHFSKIKPKPFIANNLNIIYSKVNFISPKTKFLKLMAQPSSLIGQTSITIERKTSMFRQKVFMTYKIHQANFYFKKITNLKTNRIFKFFKKILTGTFFYLVDLFQASIRTVSNFFEKPAEYTTTWIAFGFLVEWSSDPITIIPENVDIYIWNVFSKISREKNIQFVFNSYYGLLTLFTGFNSKFQLTLFPNSYGNLNYLNISSFVNLINIPVLLTISHLLQRRIRYFFDILMETISQPDTDLIARQEKGTLFWDIWADFLVTAADYYNVNVAALSTIKAEQNALIENISNDFGTLVNSKQMKMKSIVTLLPFNKKDIKMNVLKNHIIFSNFDQTRLNIQKQLFVSSYFVDQIKDLTKKDEPSLNNFIEKLFSPNIIFCNPNKGAMDLLYNASNKLGTCTIKELKLESILANLNRWSINQYITYQSWHSHNGSNNANGDLFIDYHLPKSFSHIPAIQYNSILQQPIGTLVCQIYSGIFNQQISKNILLVNTKTTTKNVLGTSSVTNYNALLIQALAGETELKIVTDNAQRYALVNRGFAIGIKLLRDVFDAIALNTPCIFLLEDIHTIGERRPMLISDSGGTLADDIGDIQLDFFGSQRDEIHEKNQVVYQLTRHAITHYKKPFRGDYSLAIPTNLYLADLFLKLPSQSISNLSLVENHNLTIKNKIKNQNFFNFFYSLKTSYINIIRQTKKKLAPPSTSPFSVLLLKEEKKLRPNKIVEELPWTGLPTEQLSTKPRASYSVRAKVAMLAELSLSNMSAKLDMITDLLVIIDSVRSNKGFVVFATTDVPHVLDPALRRPGRLDETICLPNISNSAYANYEIIKSSRLKDYNKIFKAGVKYVSMGLPMAKHLENTFYNVMLHSNNVLILNNKKNMCNCEKKTLVNKQRLDLSQNAIPQQGSALHSTFTTQALNKRHKDKATAYYVVGKDLLNFYLNTCVRTNVQFNNPLNTKSIPLLNKIVGTSNDLTLKNINYLSLYSSKTKIILQLMLVFGGKISQLLGSKNFVNMIKLQSKKAMFQTVNSLTFDCINKNNSSKLLEAILSQTLFGFEGECVSLSVTPNENLRITTSMLLSFIHKRYLYKKNLIVPKLLSFTDGNILEEPPCPPFSNLLIPAKRFENYKRVFHDSIVSNKMGQRKAQISFIEKLQNQTQLHKIKELKSLFSNVQKSRKVTQNTIQQDQLKQFGNLTTVPDENLVQTTTNINWYYQNRILKRHGYYLTNQWWNGQLSEHNVETVFLSDIDWRSSFIKNKQISTNFQQKNSSDGLDILLDFPDTDQYYNPRRRRWLLNKGYWSFWFNFDKVYSEEIISTCILESIIETYRFLHNNTELLDFVTNKFIVLDYYLGKTKIIQDKTTYPKTDLTLQRTSSPSLNANLLKAIPRNELRTLIKNSFQRF
nr:cell division protein [Eudorina elegans]